MGEMKKPVREQYSEAGEILTLRKLEDLLIEVAALSKAEGRSLSSASGQEGGK